MDSRIFAALALMAIGALTTARAQGIASGQLIDSIVVTGAREQPAVDVPSPTASKTASDLRAQNLVNPEDALKYLPNLTIRKRYIGDRNALIGGRSFSTLQAARGLVFMDDYLLSNFLGRFDAPRWNMVAPEEIERVDVLYGPFSALYPGNSIGTTVAIRTRRPDRFEAGVRTTAFTEQFSEYGLEDDYSGYQVSGFLADRFERSWFALAANRQDGTGHPMQYYAVSANAAGQFPVVSSTGATPVSGVTFDLDPQGRRRAVFGASAGAIDHSVQDQMKIRAGYEIGDTLELEGFVAGWRNRSEASDRTFMRDAQGHEIWSGRVIADGIAFNVPLTALAPNTRDEEHMQWGATLRTTRAAGLNGSLVYSAYDIREDFSLQANTPDPTAAAGGPGTITERDGTGWQTFEVQGTYTPIAGDRTGGAHELAFGYHRNDYELANPVYATTDWRSRSGTLVQNVFGKTRLQALYLQDHWQWSDHWSMTVGARYENWDAYDGGQRAGTAVQDYDDRAESAWSPKLSIAYAADEAWNLRLSLGRGVRFPTVSELFQGTATATSITVNDPNLQPEVSDSVDLSYEREFRLGHMRVSLFQDDVRDSIFAQTNITVTPSVTNVQNVDRVRTRGVELAYGLVMPGYEALTFEGSVAYAKARILENHAYPVSVGNIWPRVPDWRATLQAMWRPSSQWLASLGARYSGRMYNRLENDDINPDTYGGVSKYTILDARVAYTTSNQLELAIGIDNLTDERAYQSHPYPARTAYAEARWSFGEHP